MAECELARRQEDELHHAHKRGVKRREILFEVVVVRRRALEERLLVCDLHADDRLEWWKCGRLLVDDRDDTPAIRRVDLAAHILQCLCGELGALDGGLERLDVAFSYEVVHDSIAM